MSEPKYKKIANDLKSKILNEEYKVNESIPTEAELQTIYDVSRYTVRQAINLLVTEDILVKKKGSGTYVKSKGIKRDIDSNGPKKIGLVISSFSDYIFPSIIEGVESTLSEQGTSLLVSSTDNTFKKERTALEMMINQGVDGLIIEPVKSNTVSQNLKYYSYFLQNDIPFVLINGYFDYFKTSTVRNDDVKAGYMATEHLINKGHENILLITKIDDMQGYNRLKGYLGALQAHGIEVKDKYILEYTTETLGELFEDFRNLSFDDITAIVSYNDELSYELIQELEEMNLKIPENISLVSHDDIIVNHEYKKKITSISHPKEQLGVKAAEQIINVFDNGYSEFEDIILTPELVLGDTVREIN